MMSDDIVHGARMLVSLEALRLLLGMPDNATIVKLFPDNERRDMVIMIVHHEDLPAVRPGEYYSNITPRFCQGKYGAVLESWGWNDE